MVLFDVAGKFLDDGAAFDAAAFNGGAEHQSLEAAATAQGHIDLAVGKGGPGIDDNLIKGKPLALMNSDGPGQFQGELNESSRIQFLQSHWSFHSGCI